MQDAALITILIMIACSIQVYFLVNQKMKKEIIITAGIIIISLFYCYNAIFNWDIPNLPKFIGYILSPFVKMVYGEVR